MNLGAAEAETLFHLLVQLASYHASLLSPTGPGGHCGPRMLCCNSPCSFMTNVKRGFSHKAIGKVLGKVSAWANCPLIPSGRKSVRPFFHSNID